MKVSYVCAQCGISGVRRVAANSPIPKNRFCSRACKDAWQVSNIRGENNPNFGNKMCEDSKRKISEAQKLLMTPERREEIGKQHKGKKLSEETIKKIHGHRTKESYSNTHTEESRRKIAIKSSEKFSKENYKSDYRKVMEDRGYWVPLKDKSAYEIYVIASDWIENMISFQSSHKVIEINRLGIFNNKTNKSGLVRDHKYSRKAGFDNKVFPELLRHPVNCEFITHAKNSGKSARLSLSLTDLFLGISNFTGEWQEQKKCLELIELYNSGFRWDVDKFIEERYNE